MSAKPLETRCNVIPSLRYRRAPEMIDWLCRAFGFEARLTVPDGSGGIAHAQLVFGAGMIMLGSVRDDGGPWRQPDEAGGETQAPYIVVEDPDAHCARAKEAGAEILTAVADQDYGGRLYSCRDPEGHLWHFGSYDPWAETD